MLPAYSLLGRKDTLATHSLNRPKGTMHRTGGVWFLASTVNQLKPVATHEWQLRGRTYAEVEFAVRERWR